MMSGLDWLASDNAMWGLLGLAAIAFIWNGARRIAWEEAWSARKLSIQIPEAMQFYGAKELKTFADVCSRVWVKGEPALAYYANKILRGSDIAYALALATITTYVWFRLWTTYLPSAQESWTSSTIVWFAPYCGAMAIAYGAADIAEDLKLASILWPRKQEEGDRGRPEIDRAEAAAAHMLTVIKMLTLLLSVIGFVLFLLLRWTQTIVQGLWGLGTVSLSELFNRFIEQRGARAGTPATEG